MTLDTQRLLLAAEMRKIAIELRDAAAKKAVPPSGNATADQSARQIWKDAQPLSLYAADARRELEDIAKTIS